MYTGSVVGVGTVSPTLASAIDFLSHSSTFFQKKVTTLSWLLMLLILKHVCELLLMNYLLSKIYLSSPQHHLL